jgi:hypothetical protein
MDLKTVLNVVATIKKNEVGASQALVDRMIYEIHYKYLASLCKDE